MKTGIELIAIERKEQIEKHGWSEDHDSFNDNGELLQAAKFCLGIDEWPQNWDLIFADKISFKDKIGKLKIAGALIAAEIDRLQTTIKIEHGEITSGKVGKVWIATTIVTKPIKAETNMQGRTKEIAEEKLKLFLKNEPYSHLDKS